MNENPNEQFPPVGKNGTATGGRTDRTKPTGTGKTRSGTDAGNGSARTAPASPANEQDRRTTAERVKPNPKAALSDDLKPGQVISTRVSNYIARYPWQTIGGLLSVLLTIVLFKVFYQGKNWKARRMAEEAYYMANQYARNNNANLQPYLSQAFRQAVRQIPGLLPLSMQSATRGGIIAGAESVNLREITPDSVIVELKITFENGDSATTREEKRYQPLVYERDQWRLGLTYQQQ